MCITSGRTLKVNHTYNYLPSEPETADYWPWRLPLLAAIYHYLVAAADVSLFFFANVHTASADVGQIERRF